MTIVELSREGPPKRDSRFSLAQREAGWGFLFISPWILGFLDADPGTGHRDVHLHVPEPEAQPADAGPFRRPRQLRRPCSTMRGPGTRCSSPCASPAIALPVGLILPFALALLLNSRSAARVALASRRFFFMPYIIPFVAALFAWGSMLNAEPGWLNGMLAWVGIDGPDWLNDPSWIYPGLVVIGLWGIGSAMIINIAGLQNVPTELYDAARVDGAGFWGQLRHVTLPMMSPVIFYSLTLGLVGVLQYFLVPLVLNSGTGRPAGATYFFNIYIYNTFLSFGNMSYGATLAWFLFVVILLTTLVLFWSARYWVYYAGEKK